MMMNTS
jgi:hypothetical protein